MLATKSAKKLRAPSGNYAPPLDRPHVAPQTIAGLRAEKCNLNGGRALFRYCADEKFTALRAYAATYRAPATPTQPVGQVDEH